MVDRIFQRTLRKTDIYNFAVDNSDFAEDTYNRKRTLHRTVMVMYQKINPTDPIPEIWLVNI